MNLMPPIVIGPVSECSKAITVEGQLTGSTLKLFANNQVIATVIASGARQLIEIETSLQPAQKISATQEKDGNTSLHSIDAVIVQRRPSQLSHLTFASPLYGCGMAVKIQGAVSGAEVVIKSGNLIIGKAFATGPEARVELTQPLVEGSTITASQAVCDVVSPITPGPRIGATPGPLPQPYIHTPINQCQPSFGVNNIIPGALVVFYKNNVEFGAVYFQEQSLWVSVGQHFFHEGDIITAVQFMCKKRIQSPPSNPVKVGPPAKPNAPTIVSPICPASHRITATGLVTGALVTVFRDDEELFTCETSSPTFSMAVPDLPVESKITARQQYCESISGFSNRVSVEIQGNSNADVINTPLHACASRVRLRNLVRGAGLIVNSETLGDISNYLVATGNEMEVLVSPSLVSGDKIKAKLFQCGGGAIWSDAVPVSAAANLSQPDIETPVYVNKPLIRVKQLIPGAMLDVFVNGLVRRIVFVSTSQMDVSIPDMRVNDRIKVRQRLCDKIAEGKKEVIVAWPPPVKPVLDYPDHGDTGLHLNPTLDWHDPKKDDGYLRAKRFSINLKKGTDSWMQIFEMNADGLTQFPLTDLAPNTVYSWEVISKNQGGSSSAQSTFTTGDAPTPLPIVSFFGSILLSNDGVTNDDPLDQGQSTKARARIVNNGNALAENYKVSWNLMNDDTSTSVSQATLDIPSMDPGVVKESVFNIPGLGQGHYYIEAILKHQGSQVGSALHYVFSI